MPDKYQFLSDAWLDAAEKLIREHQPEVPPTNLVMNLEVTNGADTVKFFMGAKNGEVLFGKGATDGADLTMATDIDTARSVFISGDQQAGMQAFMAGKIRVEGDMAKLMAMQAAPVGADSSAAEMANRLKEITE